MFTKHFSFDVFLNKFYAFFTLDLPQVLWHCLLYNENGESSLILDIISNRLVDVARSDLLSIPLFTNPTYTKQCKNSLEMELIVRTLIL